MSVNGSLIEKNKYFKLNPWDKLTSFDIVAPFLIVPIFETLVFLKELLQTTYVFTIEKNEYIKLNKLKMNENACPFSNKYHK